MPSLSSAYTLFTLLAALQATAIASVLPRQSSSSNGYANPANGGGSMLTNTGEPLNIIISGNSDSQVLTPSGLLNYALSLEFATECLGQHLGGYQDANLGDGNGEVQQNGILRADFGNQEFGTCTESAEGGNHFRYWKQNGTSADTGAWFIAASIEKNATYNHDIESNGYDLGRDAIVSSAKSGSSNAGVTYSTSVQMVSGLLQSGSSGINHGISIDGEVAVFTVSASGTQSSSSEQSSSNSSSSSSGSSGSSSTTTSAGGKLLTSPLCLLAILPAALSVLV